MFVDGDRVMAVFIGDYKRTNCSVREGNYSSLITAEVYDHMNEEGKVGGNPKRSMWEKRRWTDRNIDIYISNWEWTP